MRQLEGRGLDEKAAKCLYDGPVDLSLQPLEDNDCVLWSRRSSAAVRAMTSVAAVI